MTTFRAAPLLLLLAGCGALLPSTPLAKETPLLAAQVAKEVAIVRDLPMKADVRVTVMDKAALEKAVKEESDKEWTERDAARERAFKAFGLLPRDFDLKTFLEKLLTEQIAGYYDTEKKEYFVIDAPDLSENERSSVFAHELVHAIGDQYFDLKAGEDARKDDDDRSLAYGSLVEGDAMLACIDYVLWRSGLATSMAQPGRRVLLSLIALMTESAIKAAKGEDSKVLREAPRVVSYDILFTYLAGAKLVNALRSEFGWKAVDEAFRDPPESTEQILDPAKYIDRRDRPVKIRIAAPPEGTQALVDNTLGMLNIRILFEDAHVRPSGAVGWDGDRYALWEKDGHDVLAWVTAWDGEGDAEGFESACGRLLWSRSRIHRSAVVRVADHVAVVDGLPSAEARATAERLLKESTFERAPDDARPEPLWEKVVLFPVAARRLDRVFETSLLGGLALDFRSHAGGHKFTLAEGLAMRSENNPDRTLVSFAGGLVSFSADRTNQYQEAAVDLVFDFQYHGPPDDGRWEADLLLKSISVRSSRACSGIELLWGGLLRLQWGEQVKDGEHARFLFIPLGW